MENQTIVGMYEFLEALEDAIEAASPDKRAALAAAIDSYQESFPDEFFWAIGAQAPTMLHHLMTSIDMCCRPNAQPKPKTPILSAKKKHKTK